MKEWILSGISFYRRLLSPLFGHQCRFYPSCSAYAEEAVMKKGLFVGLGMSLKRVLRCAPYHAGGFDPVE